MRVILASPRGFCAGVNMAIESLELALERFGPPVYVYHEIVHNRRVVEEFSREEPDAFQLKYYARGVGNVRVGWRGADATKETLGLVEVIQLNPEELTQVRAQVLELEKRAYERSKEVYAQTSPAE